VWTVGVAASGNGVGLSAEALERLDADERDQRLADSRAVLKDAGADFVIDSVADFLPVLDEIEARLRRGMTP